MSDNKAQTNKMESCSKKCKVISCWKWDLCHIMNPTAKQTKIYAVVILNQKITQNQEFMKAFWNNASVRITVDGGTDHWNKFLSKLPIEDELIMKVPDLITGDFDSITQDVINKFQVMGSKVIHTPDQNNTDFTKALIELNVYCTENNFDVTNVVVIAKFSGRIDQILGNIQTLFLVKDDYVLKPTTNIYIMSDNSISWLLAPGDHLIDIPAELRNNEHAWCSLVPIGEPCESVYTSGLRWNLDNQPLKFGGLISTSNTYDGSHQVKIKCSHTLLWSMMIPCLSGS